MAEDSELDPLFDMSPQARLKRFIKRVINTRYLFIAFLIHAGALVIFGGKVLFEAIQTKGEFQSESEVLVATPPGPPPPPPTSPPTEQTFDVKVSSASQSQRVTTRIATSKLSAEFNVPPPDVPMVVSTDAVGFKSDEGVRERAATAEVARMVGVRSFHQGGVTGANGKPGATGKGRQTVAKFTCYVAQYEGGDWNCNLGFIADERWYSNCIFNLMLQIERWSQGRVKAYLKPEALKIGDREWIDKIKPPFIFMTGHKNFKFTEAEVSNLREYLMLGGALWVDNSLPGRRSQFDVAFRREMKKVLPDREFEQIDARHRLFKEYFDFKEPPAGMNYYREPVEVVKIGGEVAVFYTLNAYSDLWETSLNPKDQVDLGTDWSKSRRAYIGRTSPHWGGGHYRFYRNVNRDSVVASYQFGINIVIHLLTRFQDKFKTLPLKA